MYFSRFLAKPLAVTVVVLVVADIYISRFFSSQVESTWLTILYILVKAIQPSLAFACPPPQFSLSDWLWQKRKKKVFFSLINTSSWESLTINFCYHCVLRMPSFLSISSVHGRKESKWMKYSQPIKLWWDLESHVLSANYQRCQRTVKCGVSA